MKHAVVIFLIGMAMGTILSLSIIYSINELRKNDKGMGIMETYDAIFIKPSLQKEKRWFATPYQDLKNYNPLTDTILISPYLGGIIVSKNNVW